MQLCNSTGAPLELQKADNRNIKVGTTRPKPYNCSRLQLFSCVTPDPREQHKIQVSAASALRLQQISRAYNCPEISTCTPAPHAERQQNYHSSNTQGCI